MIPEYKRQTSYELEYYIPEVTLLIQNPKIIDNYARRLSSGFLFANETFRDLLKVGMSIKKFKKILALQLEKNIDEFEIRYPTNKSAPLKHSQNAYDTLIKAEKIFICYYK